MVSTLVFYLVVLALSLLRCSADEPKGISKSPQEIIAEHGFICENHTVLTADGYKLSLVRIVNPLVAKRTKLKRPILFSHGLFESATIWLFNSKDVKPRRYPHHVDKVRYGYGPEFERLVLEPKSFADRKSGPFLLANYGYDVWLLSFRGTEYSLRHTNLTVSDPKFWDYSWDDFGLMDTPATLNYIRDLTHANKIGYVGHSQGTFAIFALLADRPHYADLVEPIIAICPVAYLGGLSSPTTRAMFASFGLASYRGQVEHGPFPPMADKMREGSAGACTGATNPFVKTMCKFVEELASGLGQSTVSI
ncbi:Triacylglycerol lipase 1 [Fragariocoptes setiger]|uniref:Triacylglycerol lipase 1 n=1 Tax=Fragariocoptes setiger TaxID=1670756 RepID=A0ABQ7S746_9ACAR|nr:Triacylglycerol lipase 1 [Fragariocoptes setiger]